MPADALSYRARVNWQGSTAVGYRAFSRTHDADAPPSAAQLRLSADENFHGEPEHLNPEQLVVMAAGSCLMMFFLGLAAMAGIDVVSYHDDAVGVLEAGPDGPMLLTTITLCPQIAVAGAVDLPNVREVFDRAHAQCFIANSLRSRYDVAPRFTVVDAAPTAENQA